MFEFFVLVTITVIIVFTLFVCIIGLLIAMSASGVSILDRLILASFCILITYLNFSYVSTEIKPEFIKTFEKEEVVRDFREVEIKGIKYLINDINNISIKVDYNYYYKLLCDEYFLNVYEDKRVNQIYFYKHSTTKGEIYGEVSCMEQKILKGE